MPLPKPNSNEEEQHFVSRCISFAVSDGMPHDQAVAACHTRFRDSKRETQKTMKNINLNYSVPITILESTGLKENEEGEFMIQGIAINATLTDNNHKFLAEELKPSAKTLVNRPLLKDHDDSVDSIVGKVIMAEFDEIGQNIRFQARINNTEAGRNIKELIRGGDLNTVSVGASVKELEQTDEFIIPRGIKFKELSLVATPADDNAEFTFNGNSFSNAITMAWKNKIQEKDFPCPHCPLIFETEDKLHKHIEKVHAKETEDKKNKSNSQTGDIVTGDNQLNTKTKKQMIEKNETTEAEVQSEEESEEETPEENASEAVLKNIEAANAKNEKRFEGLEATQKATTEILSDLMKGVKSLQTSIDDLKVKEADVDEEETKEEPAEEAEEPTEEVESEEESKPEEEPEAEAEEESEDEDESEDVDEQSDYKIQAGHRFFTVVKNKYR